MKKLISLILALVMCLSLFACGKAENEDETKKKSEKDEKKETVYEDKYGELAKEAEEKLPEYVLEAIRAYYGLDFGAELTDKMVASVETLTIDIPAVAAEANMVYIDAAVNGSSFTGTGVRAGGRVYPARMENIRTMVDEFGGEMENAVAERGEDAGQYYRELFDRLGSSKYNFIDLYNTNRDKFPAYSNLLDINAPGLDEKSKNEILEMYPDITETGPFYVYETNMSVAEVQRLIEFCVICTEAEASIPMGELDISYLEIFPNLKSVQCDERFNAKNCPVKLETLEASVLKGHYKCGDNLTWTFDGETLTIKGEGDMWDFSEKGTPWWCDMTSVVIEKGVTSIGADAFSGFGLEKITIADSATKIGANAFNGCKNLTEIDLPDSLSYIGDAAFKNCTGLTTLKLPNSVTEIGECAFMFCENIKTITFSSSLEVISQCAFAQCSSIKIIIIPASVTSISNDSFSGCDNLLLVTYLGTKAEWDNLFEDGFDKSANRFGVKCSDGMF